MFRRISFVSALLASSALISSGASAADIIEEIPPTFTWSGFYIGAHAGVAWGDNGRNGCKAFRDIVGEHGGPPVFDSAADIVDNDDYSAEIDGCFDALITDSDSPNDGETVRAFDLDGDAVALTNGHGNDDDANFLFGPQIGINQQYGGLVLGLEADASWLGGNNGNDIEFEYFHELSTTEPPELENFEGVGRVSGGDLDWIATFRARAGVVVGSEGRGLIYGTGGVAIAGIDGLKGHFDDEGGRGWCSDGCVFRGGDDDIEVGYAIGVGGEWAWTDTVSFGAEFLHVGFNDDNGDKLTFHADDGRAFSFENNVDDLNIVRLKLNLRFPPS